MYTPARTKIKILEGYKPSRNVISLYTDFKYSANCVFDVEYVRYIYDEIKRAE